MILRFLFRVFGGFVRGRVMNQGGVERCRVVGVEMLASACRLLRWFVACLRVEDVAVEVEGCLLLASRERRRRASCNVLVLHRRGFSRRVPVLS